MGGHAGVETAVRRRADFCARRGERIARSEKNAAGGKGVESTERKVKGRGALGFGLVLAS